MRSMFRRKKKKGFTLIEIMIGLLVFVILMSAVSRIFVVAFSSYRDARTVQKDLQNAQFTLNSMAKILRTSTVVSDASVNGTNRIKLFDYSQGENGLCVEYIIQDSSLAVTSAEGQDADQCDDEINFSSSDFTPLIAGNVSGKFIVTPSEGGSSKKVGKVTVSLTIYESDRHQAHVQSSTSLRDYGNIDW